MIKGKLGKWLNWIVSSILMVTLIGVASLVIVTKFSGGEPEVFGYQIKTVLFVSMEPDIQTGSIIAVKTVEDGSKFKKGDVITFMADKNKLVTHRIIDVKKTKNGVAYTTKGDNNNAADSNPVLADNVVGEYKGVTIPYLGYVANFAQSPNGSIFLLIVPGILLLCYAGFSIWRTLAKLETVKKSEHTG